MAQSDYYGTQTGPSSIKDTLHETADTVQKASAEAYETVRDAVDEQPFLAGILIGAIFGFALGALWKLEPRRSLPAHAYDTFWSYAGPPLRRFRDRTW